VRKRETLDASGLRCPLPVLRARRAIEALAQGDVLTVTTTDPASEHDVPAWTNEAGHKLLSKQFAADSFIFEIEVNKVLDE